MDSATGPDVEELRQMVDQREATIELLQEAFVELEFELDEGWIRLAGGDQYEFTRPGLKKIIGLSRIMWLKNPLIQRAVNVQAFYTWAQGVQIRATDDTVNEVLQRFLDDPGNRRAFSGELARQENDQTLAKDGNLFFVLFPNVVTGHVRIRTIAVDEITDVYCNPQDRSEPWLYLREWQAKTVNASGVQVDAGQMRAYYPDMRWTPKMRPSNFAGLPVMWDSPVMHMKTGGLKGMRFGVPETYAALDWAKAYKNFLEDWASLVRSLSRFAWRLTTKNSKVAAAKQKLATTIGIDQREQNPPSTAGAAFVGDENVKMDAIPKTGATPGAEDGKFLGMQVGAAMNIPWTLLSGDVDQGNLATAKTLDRPTELAFLTRQQMWREVHNDLTQYVVAASIKATRGRLTGTVTIDDDGLQEIEIAGVDDPSIEVKFPPILEHDVLAAVQAVTAAYQGGANTGVDAGLLPKMWVAQQLLSILGAENVDELMEELEQQADEAEAAGIPAQTVAAIKEATRVLRESAAA